MVAVVIDQLAMSSAAPVLERYLDALDHAAELLRSTDVPAGVPPELRGKVERVLADASSDLRGAVRALDHLPAELRRRASAARQADGNWSTAVGLGLSAVRMFTGSFSATELSRAAKAGWTAKEAVRFARAGDKNPVIEAMKRVADGPNGALTPLQKGAGRIGKGAAWAGGAVTAYNNFRDPKLSTTQKITRTAASIGAEAGVGALSGAASGAMFGSAAGPPGFLIGAGAGLAWTVADAKLGISNKVGDAAAGAVEGAGDLAGDAARGLGGAAKGAEKLFGKIL